MTKNVTKGVIETKIVFGNSKCKRVVEAEKRITRSHLLIFLEISAEMQKSKSDGYDMGEMLNV